MILLPFAMVAGYAAGAVIAVFLDRMYTGAPLRGPVRLCGDGARPALWWSGAVGFLLARGRCPSGCRLPARLLYLPLLGALAGAVIALEAVDARHAALVTVFSVVLLAFVGTDFDRHLLPNRLMYPALALGLVLCWAWPDRSAAATLTGGVIGLVVMFVLFMLLPGFGFGDVKLAALLGLVAGSANIVPALMIGVVAGGAGSLALILSRRGGVRTAMAYGPYLALGAFAGMLMR